MSGGDQGAHGPAGSGTILGLVRDARDHRDTPTPSAVQEFSEDRLAEHAASLDTFWLDAKNALHSAVGDEDAVGLISTLLDLSLAVHKASGAQDAVPLFELYEEAFQVLPLAKMRELITHLELRRAAVAPYAEGKASIVLLRTGRNILNRLNPKLHALDTGRVLTLLALSKGIAHPSRLNRKGLVNQGEELEAPDDKSSIEFAVYALQDFASRVPLEGSTQFLEKLLSRTMRFTLSRNVSELVPWKGLTWEQAEQTLNGLIFVFTLLFALPAVEGAGNDNTQPIVERLEKRLTNIFRGLGLSTTAEQVETLESQWIAGRAYKPHPPRDLTETLLSAGKANTPKYPPPLVHSLGNEKLTQLWTIEPGIARFEEKVDWTSRADKFESHAESNPSWKYMALKCRPFTQLVADLSKTPPQTHDLSEWEAKLPTEKPAAAPVADAVKRPNDLPTPVPAPKRARIAYEDVDPSSSTIDRQRALESTARPLPY